MFSVTFDESVFGIASIRHAKIIGELSIRAIISKNVLLGKQCRLLSGFSRFSPVASSSSAVFPFNYQVVKALSLSALTNRVQIVVMRKRSSEYLAYLDRRKPFMNEQTRGPFWKYVTKFPPRNVYAEMDNTFRDLLREGKIQLRFLIPGYTVETLADAGNEFLNCLDEHGASLELSDWELPEGVLTLVCPLDKVTECFKKILPKIADDTVRLLFHGSYRIPFVGAEGKAMEELLKQKQLEPDQFSFYKNTCPYSTDRVYQLKGDEKTMLYLLDHIIDVLKRNIRDQIEVPFNEQSHVGALVKKYGGYGPNYFNATREDGLVSVRFSIPRVLFALFKKNDGDYSNKSIRKLTGAELTYREPGYVHTLSLLRVIGLPVQVEQVCYMLKQGLEMTEDGKTYLCGKFEPPSEW